MTHAKIQITRFVDDAQPGWVEAVLIDAWKQKWTFVQKIHSFTEADLDADSEYPVEGVLECKIVGGYLDRDGRLVAIIRGADECTDRTYLFEVDPKILTNRETGKVGMDLPFEVEPLSEDYYP